MQLANVPLTGPRYWWAIGAASIFGVNLGDFIARNLHLGHWQALPGLLVLFGLALLAERRSPPGREIWYWAAVLIGRTAATNLADLGTHDWGLDYEIVVPAGLPILFLVVALGRAVAPASPEDVARLPAGRPVANLTYWLALFIAEVVGTAAGDAIPDVLDWTQREEFLLLALLTVSAFALRTDRRFQGPAFYWVTIFVIATVGLSVGDYIAHSGRLWVSTLLTGLFFLGTLVALPRERRTALVPA